MHCLHCAVHPSVHFCPPSTIGALYVYILPTPALPCAVRAGLEGQQLRAITVVCWFLTSFRLQLVQSIAENARLRAENRDLRSQLGMAAVNNEPASNLDDMPMLANTASTLDDFLETQSSPASLSFVKPFLKPYVWIFSAKAKASRPLAHEMCHVPRNTHWYDGFFHKDCSLTKKGIDCVKNSIEYKGNSGHPKWNVRMLACNGVISKRTPACSGLVHTDSGW